MRKLASIQKIDRLKAIDGATNIEVADILGWHVVVKREEFAKDDPVVYIEVDSLLPEKEEFEFLRKNCFVNNYGFKGFRIRTSKLRGQVSQGIAFPLDILPEGHYDLGDDVTDIMGIQKYEKPIPMPQKAMIRGNFPAFIPKTDEMRIQVVPQVLLRHSGKTFYVTEKLDGTSMTVFRDAETGMHVCSRNMDLKPDYVHKWNGSSYWHYAIEHGLEELLKSLGNVALQGELLGPGVQGGKYQLNELQYRVFNVYDIDNHRYMESQAMNDMVEAFGLGKDFLVPYIGEITLSHSVDNLIDMAKGKSMLCDRPREGLVFRSLPESTDPDLGRLSFKAINQDFLLKWGE
ncbi:RNA ligase (ATP) [Candidatus Pacearchaeota archaeon]|jgi:RNA ligase (TIGR02306 family)|nr:RNA ligase (ATP) [Candidatus Pacearchaeota archaeon]